MRIVNQMLTNVIFFDKILPTVAGSFAANVSRVNRVVKTKRRGKQHGKHGQQEKHRRKADFRIAAFAEGQRDNDFWQDDWRNACSDSGPLSSIQQGRRGRMSRAEDVRIEQVCGRFVDKYFYTKLRCKFERNAELSSQYLGVDVTIWS